MGVLPWAKNQGPGGHSMQPAPPPKPPTKPYVHSDAREQNQNQQRWANSTQGGAAINGAADARREANWLAQMFPTGGAPSGGGGGGGSRGGGGRRGGGGGGYAAARDAEMKAAAQSQIDMLTKLLGSGKLRTDPRQFVADYGRQDDILQAHQADQGIVADAAGDFERYLGGVGNAYRSAPASQGATMDVDDLGQLIGAQGGSDAGLRAEAQYLQGQSANQAGAQNRLQENLANMQDQWNTSLGTESQMATRYANSQLDTMKRAQESALGRDERAERMQIDSENRASAASDKQAIMQLIAQISQLSAGAGLKTPDFDIDKLLSLGGMR